MTENGGDGTAPSSSRARRIVRIVRRIALGIHAAFLAPLLLRIVLRDLVAPSEFLFIVPAFVFAVPALLTAPFIAGGKRVRLVLHPLLALALLWTVFVEQPRLVPLLVPSPATDSERDVTLASWNVMSYNLGNDDVVAGFQEGDPDIVCLLEGTYRSRPPGFLRRAVPPEFQWASTLQMAIGSRFPIVDEKEYATRTRLRVFRATLDVRGEKLSVYLVDMPSPPRGDTEELFAELRTILDGAEHPFVLTGDFNTTRGSWRMAGATRGMRDFYRSSPGNRWLASWDLREYYRVPRTSNLFATFPVALAFVQIDHSFASPGILPVAADLVGPGGSDHYRQFLVFRLDDG